MEYVIYRVDLILLVESSQQNLSSKLNIQEVFNHVILILDFLESCEWRWHSIQEFLLWHELVVSVSPLHDNLFDLAHHVKVSCDSLLGQSDILQHVVIDLH